jgi:hypothetical protein
MEQAYARDLSRGGTDRRLTIQKRSGLGLGSAQKRSPETPQDCGREAQDSFALWVAPSTATRSVSARTGSARGLEGLGARAQSTLTSPLMTVTSSRAITFHRSGRPAIGGAIRVGQRFVFPARSGRPIAPIARGDGDLCYVEGMPDDAKPKLFDRLTLPPNAVDVMAEAVITAAIGAGRYTPEEQAIIRCIAAAQPDLPLTPEWIAMCLDQARALGEL